MNYWIVLELILKKKFEIRVNIDENGIIYNSKKYLEYANKLKKQLKYI